MGRPLFPITSGNSWIIQWAPVDYVVSKTLGLPLGKEDKRQGGIKTCLKVKEFNRSGSYSFREVSEAERKSSTSAGLLAKETCTTWRSGDVQISCKAPNTGTALLLPYQSKGNAPSAPTSRIQGSRLSETHHVFGNKHRLYPLNFPIPNRTVRRISPAVQLREKPFSDNPSELINCSTFLSPAQSRVTQTGQEEQEWSQPLSEANTKPSG